MQSRTVIRSTTIVFGLLLMSLLLLFSVYEYEKNMAFQWENMVQPHWEGAVPQEKSLLPLVDDKVEDIVITPQETLIEQTPVEKKNITAVNTAVKTEPKSEPKPTVAKVAVKSESVAKTTNIQKRALRLRMSDDNLYRNHPSSWEAKKQKVMPDFFAPKVGATEGVQMDAHLIMDGDEKASSSKKKQDEDAGYLDGVQGAEFNFSIKMR